MAGHDLHFCRWREVGFSYHLELEVLVGPMCKKCGEVMATYLREQGHEFHPICAPDSVFGEPEFADGLPHDPYTEILRGDIIAAVKDFDSRSERKMQVEVGASEVGYDCLRRIGYRIADIATTNNETDPWPAIVGTAVHSWLEKAFTYANRRYHEDRWLTEVVVHPSDAIKGHTDLYDAANFVTIDHKTAGTDKMREIRKGNIPPSYIEQVQLYALGHVRAGRRVDRVALVFYPRSGWLHSIAVWSAPFDEAAALAVLDKVNRVAAGVIRLGVQEDPQKWKDVPATPTKDCTWCPWYQPLATVASDAGCPGK